MYKLTPLKIVEMLRRGIYSQTDWRMIPYHRGLRILVNVEHYLNGNYIGHMSWTLQFFNEIKDK